MKWSTLYHVLFKQTGLNETHYKMEFKWKASNFSRLISKSITLITLLIFCYFFYLKEAIENFQKGAKTVITTSEKVLEYTGPAVTICPNYAFKPSFQKFHKFDFPTRSIFGYKEFYSDHFKTKSNTEENVESLYKNATYSDDLNFNFNGVYLEEGTQNIQLDIEV